jgi:hypothetical protein
MRKRHGVFKVFRLEDACTGEPACFSICVGPTQCHVMKILRILKLNPTQDSAEYASWIELRF